LPAVRGFDAPELIGELANLRYELAIDAHELVAVAEQQRAQRGDDCRSV
jgi:hypothetical protein